MTSIQYLDFIVKQLPREKVEKNVEVILEKILQVFKCYLPQELIEEKMSQMFELLLSLIKNGETDKNAIADQIFELIASKEQLKLSIVWLKSGYIEIDTQKLY
jgi:hypothetical protein